MPASVVAIDGPVASGKTAVGRLLAQRLGHRFLDTGLMYRAIAAIALRLGVDPSDEQFLGTLARSTRMDVGSTDNAERLTVNGEDVTGLLRTPDVEASVSLVARLPRVREILVAQQRRLAAGGRIVMAGRDIGTVVLPDAPLKLFLKASPEVRAQRRWKEMQAHGSHGTYDDVLANVRSRDEMDISRAASPLKPAGDAHIIDTDKLTLRQVVDRTVALAGAD